MLRPFARSGSTWTGLTPRKPGSRSPGGQHRWSLASYVDDWAMQRLNARDKKEEASWRRLLAAARAADPDPWRVALREQMGGHGLDALRRLAANERDSMLSRRRACFYWR